LKVFLGLLLTTSKKWQQRRKIITSAFHFKILEQFTEIMERQGQVFVTNLKKFEGQDVDVFPMAGHYALDVICGKSQQLVLK
jgi:cytochrome P450 family 4